MPDWLTLLLVVAASFRLTRLVTSDRLTAGLRARVWQRWPDDDTLYPDDGTISQDRDDPALGTTAHGVRVFYDDSDREFPGWRPVYPTLAGYLVGCDWCASLYVSGLVLLAWWLIPTVVLPILSVLALAAAVGIVAHLID